MNTHDKERIIEEKDSDFRRLLSIAGKRIEPPEEIRSRVYKNVLEEWETLDTETPITETNKEETAFSLRFNRSFGIAASFILATVMFAGGWTLFLSGPQPHVAQLRYTTGVFTVHNNQGETEMQLTDGASVRTSDNGRLEVSVLENTKVRLDINTEVSFGSDAHMFLHKGRIYVDSPGASESVNVMTPYGPVTDIGTQFLVGVTQEVLEVAVRQGLVNVALSSGIVSVNSQAGDNELVTIDHQETVERSLINANDERWRWVRLAAAEFDLNSSTVFQFLEWATSEAGFALQFENENVEALAKQTRLHGSLNGADPGESIALILSTTRFESKLHDGKTLLVLIKK